MDNPVETMSMSMSRSMSMSMSISTYAIKYMNTLVNKDAN